MDEMLMKAMSIEQWAKINGHATFGDLWPEDFAAVLNECARLRSDEWLEKAAEELVDLIVFSGEDPRGAWVNRALAILRKHRDGKA